MPTRCFVPNCCTGYDKKSKFYRENKLEEPHLFKAPSNPDLLKQWQHSIPRLDRILSSKDYVCEKHFSEKFIERFFRTDQLPDKKEFLLPRERPVLLPDAVPTKFPNCPKYLSKKSPRKRKPPAIRFPDTVKKRCRRALVNTPPTITESTISTELTCDTIPDSQCPTESALQTEDFTFDTLLEHDLVRESWSKLVLTENNLRFLCWPSSERRFLSEKYVDVDRNLSVQLLFGNVVSHFIGYETLHCMKQFSELLAAVESTNVCPGAVLNKYQNCIGYVRHGEKFCGKCKITVSVANRLKKSRLLAGRRINQSMKKKIERLKDRVNMLQRRIETMQDECAKLNGGNVLEEAVRSLNLNENMKANILNCIKIANVRDARGRRYTQKWLYECILLKIKDTKAYEHIIRHKLMPLPCVSTISRYIRGLKPAYGFQEAVFKMLKEKSCGMSSMEREGALLIDEMNVRETYQFDRNSMKVLGFTDLGELTPPDQKNQLGNHALVIMYQPYQGLWLQPIGCFLSRGAASSSVLYQIIVEAVILMENSGFRVDNITTDGASWNRAMWKKFGVSTKQVHCEHILDPSRKLWFLSDFPHLIKNVRNWMVKNRAFETPDGPIYMKHWEELLKVNQPEYALKCAYKLTESHVHPRPYQKMNIALAYQLFDFTIADAMELYKETENHRWALNNCESSCKFMRRIRKLIIAMSSRCPKGALRNNDTCTEKKCIEEFLVYLSEWEKKCVDSNYTFLTDNTAVGLQVSLRATLEILDYLTSDGQFSYLMTSRLNQDNLERFFGMIRAAGGNDDHPDSVKLSLIYKLMSAYSLLKPPKGSNISETETFEMFCHQMKNNTLHVFGSLTTAPGPVKEELMKKFDTAVEDGSLDFDDAIYEDISIEDQDRFCIEYVGGYVARKSSSFTSCNECIASLRRDEGADDNLIKIRNKFGALYTPTHELLTLIEHLEKVILSEMKGNNLNPDTFLAISRRIDENALTSLGCVEHTDTFTAQITQFYLIMRMNFICRTARKNLAAAQKSKKLKKEAKLTKEKSEPKESKEDATKEKKTPQKVMKESTRVEPAETKSTTKAIRRPLREKVANSTLSLEECVENFLLVEDDIDLSDFTY